MAITRRDHLAIIAAAATMTPALAQDHVGHLGGPHYTAPVIGPFEPKFFTAEEGLVIARLADLIIPETDTPGAVKAGVPQYIDSMVAKDEDRQKTFRAGVAWLDQQAQTAHGKKFAEVAEAEQLSLLTPLMQAADERTSKDAGVVFLREVKTLTCGGYYTSYAGLVQELGYCGNQMLSHFDGCEHNH